MSSINTKEAMVSIDVEVCQHLKEVVDEITGSGEKELNVGLSKKFKTICKKSDAYVEQAYHLIMAQLEKDHAEIRLSALLLIDVLFTRSNCFRELLLADFQDFMPLCLDIDHELPLPPPKPVAQLLQRKAVECLQKWQDNYGQAYKKLSLGYNYLKTCKKIDFANYQARTLAEQQREDEKQRRKEALQKEQLQAALQGFREFQEEANTCLVQIKSCFSLLIPDPETFELQDLPSSPVSYKGKGGVGKSSCKGKVSIQEEENSASSDEDELAVHGMLSQKYALSITVPEGVSIEETQDNTDVLATLKDSLRLIESKQLPSLSKSLEVFAKCGADQKSIKEALDLKEMLQSMRHKVISIHVKPVHQERKTEVDESDDDDDHDDDDDFEEVPTKEGYEADIPEFLKEAKKEKTLTNRHWTLPKIALNKAKQESDPTTWLPTIQKMKQSLKREPPARAISPQPSTSEQDPERQKQLQKAPFVPYSTDLYFWGQNDAEIPLIVRNEDDSHRFWRPVENDSKVDQKALAEMKSRVISYPGQFEEVKWKCRAPLSSGKLCERMDRKKCPFHGVIVPRNVIGQPTREEDIVRLAKEDQEAVKKKAEWDDPDLQQEIEAAKGVKLQRSKRKKRAKNPNLTDIKKISDTNRNRLKSKVFDKSAQKRVASAMDSLDHKRYKDKFANQFNYAYNT